MTLLSAYRKNREGKPIFRKSWKGDFQIVSDKTTTDGFIIVNSSHPEYDGRFYLLNEEEIFAKDWEIS